MKYLIVGLGNVGNVYQNTRHNIGFTILDAFAKASNIFFTENRYGATSEFKIKGRTLILLKPSTFMNLSGIALRYWMNKENIPIENVLILVDDIALPFGKLQLKPKGSDAGHNGLKNINEILGHSNYARLRFGLGDDFKRGQQIDYVLGKWTDEQSKAIAERAEYAAEMIKSFCLAGLELTMTQYNKK